MLGNEVMNKEQLYDLYQQILGVKKFEHQLLYNAMQVRFIASKMHKKTIVIYDLLLFNSWKTLTNRLPLYVENWIKDKKRSTKWKG